MSRVVLVLLGLFAATGEPPQSPSTRLYVHCIPAGATILLEGKVLGKADGLFEVVPGTQTLLVELDGFLPEERHVEIRAEEITRVELQLKKRPETPGQTGTPAQPTDQKVDPEQKDDAGSKAANAYLIGADLPAPVRDAMLSVLRHHRIR